MLAWLPYCLELLRHSLLAFQGAFGPKQDVTRIGLTHQKQNVCRKHHQATLGFFIRLLVYSFWRRYVDQHLGCPRRTHGVRAVIQGVNLVCVFVPKMFNPPAGSFYTCAPLFLVESRLPCHI